MAADLVMEDKPVAQAPRVVLKKLMKEAADKDLYIKTGVECEFFLTKPSARRFPMTPIAPPSPATISRR